MQKFYFGVKKFSPGCLAKWEGLRTGPRGWGGGPGPWRGALRLNSMQMKAHFNFLLRLCQNTIVVTRKHKTDPNRLNQQKIAKVSFRFDSSATCHFPELQFRLFFRFEDSRHTQVRMTVPFILTRDHCNSATDGLSAVAKEAGLLSVLSKSQ